MIVSDVMDELAARLSSIPDLRVHDMPMGTVSPPAVLIGYPEEIVYGMTGGRGMDQMMVPVIVVVGRPFERSSKELFSSLTSGDDSAIVRALRTGATTSVLHVARVVRASADVYTIGAVDYLAVVFDVEVTGRSG